MSKCVERSGVWATRRLRLGSRLYKQDGGETKKKKPEQSGMWATHRLRLGSRLYKQDGGGETKKKKPQNEAACGQHTASD